MHNNIKENELNKFAANIRLELLKMLQHLGYGHYGGSLSIVEALAVLYGKHINIEEKNKDYFILSKGHSGPALYATLALKGIIDKEMLKTLNQNKTNLPSHPDRLLTPGIDMTTGSLGQGLSVSCGVAKALKLDNKSSFVYTIVGDGELNEGLCWEAVQFATHNLLSNLIVLVDNNKRQLDGYLNNICEPLDFTAKFEAFGFFAQKVDGKNVSEIDFAIEKGKTINKPKAIILDTIKGQGVQMLEEKVDNHHVRLTEQEKNQLADIIKTMENELGGGQA